jgi:hypothetical protein
MEYEDLSTHGAGYAHFGNMLLVTHPDIQYHYQCNQVYIRNPDMILSLHKLHRDGIG